uniref:ATP-grasp-modified RiPP n=1 Tax=Streptomyces sp. ML694-90F3 TaxID=1265536 RepID=A0A077KXZ1_9ACTN|nr:hypothetical protein [Streptomyces sp. ML694-90F3]
MVRGEYGARRAPQERSIACGPPLNRNLQRHSGEIVISRSTSVPWGLSRMEPYPSARPETVDTVTLVGLDPLTQTGIYHDAAGNTVEMGKHSTHKAVETQSRTNPGDGAGPGVKDQDHDQRSEADQAQD